MNKYSNFRFYNEEIWVASNYLIDIGVPKGTIENGISRNKSRGDQSWLSIKGESRNSDSFIKINSIPPQTFRKYGLKSEQEYILKYGEKILYHNDELKKEQLRFLTEVFTIVAKNKWSRYTAQYNNYFPNHDLIYSLAATHAVFEEILLLLDQKEYTVAEMYESYINIPLDVKLYFRASTYRNFALKLKLCVENRIENTLPHKSLLTISNNLKLDDYWKRRLIMYYSKPVKMTKSHICEVINEERVKEGLDPLAYSTIQAFLNGTEIKNITLLSRHGRRKFRDDILPYFQLSSESANEIWQIDGARIPFLCKYEGKTTFLDIVIVTDFYSRRLLGYSIGQTENSVMVAQSIKNALLNTGMLPAEIIHDNHSPYYSEKTESLKVKMRYFGVNWKRTNNDSPREKGRIERVIGTLNTAHFRKEVGYIGEGIKSKREYSLPCMELLIKYRKIENLYTIPKLLSMVNRCIENYNSNSVNGKPSPASKYAQSLSSNSKKHFKILEDYMVPYFFYNSCKYKIKNSLVSINRKGMQTSNYTLPHEFRNKLNGSRVTVYHDKSMEEVFLFSVKKECRFIVKLGKDLVIPNMQSKRDEKTITYVNKMKAENIKHAKMNKKILKDADEISSYENLTELSNKKVLIEGMDDKSLLKKNFVNSIIDERVKSEFESLDVIRKGLGDI